MIDLDKVTSVYSGKPGCACGCRGQHRYASKHMEWAGKNRGFPVGLEEVNDLSVRIIVAKIEKAPRELVDIGHNNVAYETPTRAYIVYFNPEDPAVVLPVELTS